MSKRLYSLAICETQEHNFRPYMYSHRVELLKAACPMANTWTVGRDSRQNIVHYTPETTYPEYRIEPVPYVK